MYNIYIFMNVIICKIVFRYIYDMYAYGCIYVYVIICLYVEVFLRLYV